MTSSKERLSRPSPAQTSSCKCLVTKPRHLAIFFFIQKGQCTFWYFYSTKAQCLAQTTLSVTYSDNEQK